MRFQLLRPRELAQRLRSAARLQPESVEEYLDAHTEEWEALATADPHDAADILEELDIDAAADLIANLDPIPAGNVLDEMRADLGASVLGVLPVELVGDVLAEPFVESLVDLLATVRSGWPIEHDRTVQLHASVLLSGRREAQALWQRHLAAASTRLRALLECPDASAWPPRSAPALVRQVGAVNRPAVAVFKATTSDSRAKWLLVFADRLVVGNVADEALAIDDGEPENHPIGAVRLFRDRGWVADALVIGCGHHRLTIAGRIRRSFEASFGPVLERLGRRADQIEPEP